MQNSIINLLPFVVSLKSTKTNKMKFFSKLILLFTPIILVSCYSKCGDSKNLGTYSVSETAKAEWLYPVVKETLKYVNNQNDTMVYSKVNNTKDYSHNSLGQNCNEGFGDSSEDYYYGEYSTISYKSNSGISIEMKAIVDVSQQNLDSLGYVFNFGTSGPGVTSTVSFGIKASDETKLMKDLFWIIDEVKFSSELEINNKLYKNVYYNYNPQIIEPSIYFQKNIGIIAYRDSSSTLWTLIE